MAGRTPPPGAPERPGPIVEIEWSDISTTIGWREHEELEAARTGPMMPVRSVGYLVADESDRIIIIQSTTVDAHSERTAIPKAVIKKVTRIAGKH